LRLLVPLEGVRVNPDLAVPQARIAAQARAEGIGPGATEDRRFGAPEDDDVVGGLRVLRGLLRQALLRVPILPGEIGLEELPRIRRGRRRGRDERAADLLDAIPSRGRIERLAAQAVGGPRSDLEEHGRGREDGGGEGGAAQEAHDFSARRSASAIAAARIALPCSLKWQTS